MSVSGSVTSVSIGAMLVRSVPPAELADHARAVAPGLDELWVVEDLPFAGGIAQMATVLEATADAGHPTGGPKIGHGIAPAPFRNPAALAMEWASLETMHPGRVAGGIGHGVPRWMRQIGEGVASPLTLLEETIVAVRRLLGGGTLHADGRYVRIDDVTLEFPPSRAPLVSAGVMGPRSLELAGRVADGTILPEGHGPDEIAAALRAIAAGAESAGRDPAAHRLTVFVGFYCGPLQQLGPPPPDAPPGFAAVGEDPADVTQQLRSIVDAGVDSLVLVPFGDDRVGQLRLAVEQLVPGLRSDTVT